MGWSLRGRFKREGTYVYLWLIHIVVWQKPTHCIAFILQLKKKKKKKKLDEHCEEHRKGSCFPWLPC